MIQMQLGHAPSRAQINSATDPRILFFHYYHRLGRILRGSSRFAHLEAASILRLFFLDDHPLVHVVNKTTRLKFSFVIARGSVHVFSGLLKTSGTPRTVGKMTQRLGPTDTFNLDRFLSEPYLTRGEERFTVKELILHAANKIGGIHYDTKLADKFTELHTHETDSELVIRICLVEIAQLVMEALEPLTEAVSPLNSYDGFLAHYSLDDGYATFLGEQFLEKREMEQADLPTGFSWVGRIRLGNQIRTQAVFYQFRGQQDDWLFTIAVDAGVIKTSFAYKNNVGEIVQVETNSPNVFQSGLFETWFTLSATVLVSSDAIILTCRFGPFYDASSSGVGRQAPLRPAVDMVIGADLDGANGAAGTFAELFILERPDESLSGKAFEFLELKHG